MATTEELRAELGAASIEIKQLADERDALRSRIAKALAILSTPGTWSEFAAQARKALTDG